MLWTKASILFTESSARCCSQQRDKQTASYWPGTAADIKDTVGVCDQHTYPSGWIRLTSPRACTENCCRCRSHSCNVAGGLVDSTPVVPVRSVPISPAPNSRPSCQASLAVWGNGRRALCAFSLFAIDLIATTLEFPMVAENLCGTHRFRTCCELPAHLCMCTPRVPRR